MIRSNSNSVEHIRSAKLLGVIFHENLSFSENVYSTLKICYGTLKTLNNFKRFTPLKVRKSFAEALVLSNLNYRNVVYGQLPQYMINRLQRLQICAVSYVFKSYATIDDVLALNWLPVVELNLVR